MNFSGLHIGVWGTGVVGSSALRFFKKNGANLSVYDSNPMPDDIKNFCMKEHIFIYDQDKLELFLTNCDYILPSAGINLKNYRKYHVKFLNEVDIFSQLYKNRIIAVTGTIGKTTITYLIEKMLVFFGYRAQIGGNLGICLFDLLDTQHEYDYAVLELSSFQLEHSKIFVPDVAIWTNLFANHLDRHDTMLGYFFAKFPIIKNQTSEHHALIHNSVKEFLPEGSLVKSSVTYFDSNVSINLETLITDYKTHTDHYILLYELARILSLDTNKLSEFFDSFETPEHRVQYIGRYLDVDFYDDSKSTVVEATQGALRRFHDRNVILFFGGVSKGVSREHFFTSLPSNIRHICFFGKESSELNTMCIKTSIPSTDHITLEDAFTHSISLIKPGDVILFSPGGASFDLFKDYKQRGQRFQELVKNLKKSL
ncbi:MAG: UDP-N-acetylmuramoyl-L-alanine--D-glutamate ligase [Candidatus Babeliaceae bacterium]|nr:UDP-N-acetylmuramoyl-L-alanine--D-glutamate ligase [Candidatus Babeliaceae bacterium]